PTPYEKVKIYSENIILNVSFLGSKDENTNDMYNIYPEPMKKVLSLLPLFMLRRIVDQKTIELRSDCVLEIVGDKFVSEEGIELPEFEEVCKNIKSAIEESNSEEHTKMYV